MFRGWLRIANNYLAFPCLLAAVALTSTTVAFSASTARTIYVNGSNTSGIEDGTQAHPYNTIQEGIDAAATGDTIQVAPGRYFENIRMKNGITLQGSGWSTTIIDGRGQGHVIYAGPSVASSKIDGFTITNGGSGWYDSGIWCVGCSLTISNNKVDRNGGRGISAYKGSSVTIIGNIITNNGISGIYGFSSSIEILNNTIDGNVKEAGITVHNVRATIKNNIVTNNPTGILGLDDVSGLSLSYNDIWGNQRGYSPNVSIGQGNISSDPLFRSRAEGDYSLSFGSPCIDAGDPSLGSHPRSATRYDLGALEYAEEGIREPENAGKQQGVFPPIRALFDRYHNTTGDAWGAWFEENYPGQFTVVYSTKPLTYEELRQYDLFVTYLSWKRDLGPKPTPSEAAALEQYIRNGGAALLMGDDPYWDMWTNEYLNVLSEPFGVSFNDDQLLDPTDYDPNVTRVEDDPERHIVFHNLAKHPTTTGINKIWAHGTCSLISKNPRAVTIVAGDNDTYSDRYSGYPRGSYPPAVIALEHGSGRIIFSGGAVSYGADVYDNRTFIWNILKWLVGGGGEPTPPSNKKRILFDTLHREWGTLHGDSDRSIVSDLGYQIDMLSLDRFTTIKTIARYAKPKETVSFELHLEEYYPILAIWLTKGPFNVNVALQKGGEKRSAYLWSHVHHPNVALLRGLPPGVYHGEFTTGDYGWVEGEYELQIAGIQQSPLNFGRLQEYDILWLHNPFNHFLEEEEKDLLRYVSLGGAILVVESVLRHNLEFLLAGASETESKQNCKVHYFQRGKGRIVWVQPEYGKVNPHLHEDKPDGTRLILSKEEIAKMLNWLTQVDQPLSETVIKFQGTAVKKEFGPGVVWWVVSVDKLISGPQSCQSPIQVIIAGGVLQHGYVDPNIKEGDKVEVYGTYHAAGGGCSVSIPESYHYIKKIAGAEKYNLRVQVYDSVTRKMISGASVYVDDDPTSKGTTGTDGAITISIPQGYHTIRVTTVGYDEGRWRGEISKDMIIAIPLTPTEQRGCPRVTSAEILLDKPMAAYHPGETVTITVKFYSNGNLYDPSYVSDPKEGDCVCELDVDNNDTGENIHRTFSDFKRVGTGVYEVRITVGSSGTWEATLAQAVIGSLSRFLLASVKYKVEAEACGTESFEGIAKSEPHWTLKGKDPAKPPFDSWAFDVEVTKIEKSTEGPWGIKLQEGERRTVLYRSSQSSPPPIHTGGTVKITAHWIAYNPCEPPLMCDAVALVVDPSCGEMVIPGKPAVIELEQTPIEYRPWGPAIDVSYEPQRGDSPLKLKAMTITNKKATYYQLSIKFPNGSEIRCPPDELSIYTPACFVAPQSDYSVLPVVFDLEKGWTDMQITAERDTPLAKFLNTLDAILFMLPSPIGGNHLYELPITAVEEFFKIMTSKYMTLDGCIEIPDAVRKSDLLEIASTILKCFTQEEIAKLVLRMLGKLTNENVKRLQNFAKFTGPLDLFQRYLVVIPMFIDTFTAPVFDNVVVSAVPINPEFLPPLIAITSPRNGDEIFASTPIIQVLTDIQISDRVNKPNDYPMQAWISIDSQPREHLELDESGRFKEPLILLGLGIHVITVTAGNVGVNNSWSKSIAIVIKTIETPGGCIEGRITGLGPGAQVRPIPGATVTAQGPMGGKTSDPADKDGRYRIDGLLPTKLDRRTQQFYSVKAYAEGYAGKTQEDVTVSSGSCTTVDFQLEWVGPPAATQITFTATCPVDLTVTDPGGLVIDKRSAQIPGATYTEKDLDSDGDPDDQIVIPNRKPGDYHISVIPEPRAAPDDTYTLEVSAGGETTVLAKDVKIRDIPNQPYVYTSKSDVTSNGRNQITIAIAALVAIVIIGSALLIYLYLRSQRAISRRR